MRWAVVAILLGTAACHGATQTGPAWPAPSTTADDGGESIAPPDTVAAAVEKSADAEHEDAKPDASEADKPAAETEDTPAAPAAEPAPPADDDDVIITDEIVIEVED